MSIKEIKELSKAVKDLKAAIDAKEETVFEFEGTKTTIGLNIDGDFILNKETRFSASMHGHIRFDVETAEKIRNYLTKYLEGEK